jgi:uncharacterized protein (DUF2252 family)
MAETTKAAAVASNGPPPNERAKRQLQGKALRKACPRSSHADIILGQGQRDIESLLKESNRGRVKKLLPIRFGRMAQSPLAFFRGTASLQAHDLHGTPTAGISVQCCGDCHLMNFGGFATPERTLVFDINDFDETYPGPFEWDIKRLAVSSVLAARGLGFCEADARDAAETVAAAYRSDVARFAEMTILETWYAKITAADMLEEAKNDRKVLSLLQEGVQKAIHSTSEHVFHKITTSAGGELQIVDQPPLLFHPDSSEFDVKRDALPFLESYRNSLARDRQVLFDRFRLVDVAHKVVGVGSVGTRCFILLFLGQQDDPLFLQVKEARASVLQSRVGTPLFSNNGERVVTGQRLMQAASDIFLGWTQASDGRDYYVRQLRDMKAAPDLIDHTPRILVGYGRWCGKALARAHAKAGDAATISGYLGTSSKFDEAIAAYALAYADQVEKDYESFRRGIHSGRFPVEHSS